MRNLIKRYPLVTLIAWASTLLAVLVVLQGSGMLTGTAAHYVDVAAGLLQVLLTAYARQHVTPVAAPKDAYGNRLVPASMRPRRDTMPKCSHGYTFGSPESHLCGELPSDAVR